MSNNTEEAIPKKRRKRDEAIAEYKERTRAARNVARNEDPKRVLELVKDEIKRSESLYPLVQKKLDGTSAAARHTKEITNLGKVTADHINVTQRCIELSRLIGSFRRDIEVETGSLPDRQQLLKICADQQARTCYRAPTFEFFYGSIREQDLEVKEKKARIPRERDVATQATTAKEKNIEVDVEQDQTPKEVEYINRHIRRISVSNRRAPVPYFKTVVDPNSFVRTVENIFHSSFLVKEGKIGIKPDGRDKLPTLTLEENQSQEGGDENQNDEAPILHGNQSILSFSVDDYKRWIQQYDIQESAFPPRDDDDDDDDDDETDEDG